MPTKPKKEFIELAKKVALTSKPEQLSVRELLAHFWQERRGREVVSYITYKLRNLGVETDPPFDDVHIDSIVTLQPRTARKRGRPPKQRPPQPEGVGPVDESKGQEQEEQRKDDVILLPEDEEANQKAYLTIGQLKSANLKPIAVRRNDPLGKATITMMMHQLSFLPVLQSERSVDGMITWEAIGKSHAAGKPCEQVQDCMDTNVRMLALDAPLFDAVRDIIRYGAVVVQAKDKTVCGLVTSADIAEQFVTLSEPFLFLEQIENHLRGLLRRAKLSIPELRQLVDPKDSERASRANSVDDLTFGEYAEAFQRQWVWERLGMRIDRGLFTEGVNDVRRIRNSVMHFHPDGITDHERKTLSKTRELLQSL